MRNLNDELSELMLTDVNRGLADSEFDSGQMIAILSRRIEELMAGRLEELMSMMYRLDIEESKIRTALAPGNEENPATSLARLIVERQNQRMATKKKYKQNPLSDWLDFD